MRILQFLSYLYQLCSVNRLVDATKDAAAEKKDVEKDDIGKKAIVDVPGKKDVEKKDDIGKKAIVDVPGKKDAVANTDATEKSEFKGA